MQMISFFRNNDFLFGFQDPATSVMEGIIDLHNYIFFYATLVLFFVLWIMLNILYYFWFKIRYELDEDTIEYRYLLLSGNAVTHGYILEIVWTFIPSMILVAIAIPSFMLLYSMEELANPGVVVKVIGHQWYWSYEYSKLKYMSTDMKGVLFWVYLGVETNTKFKIKFDSYMLSENDLKVGQLRLLEVDKVTILPTNVHINMIVTATDVLHSWAVPSLGVKIDAVPGRLSQIGSYIKREGIFYGQCSEICGVNHGFMPIVIKAVPVADFIEWSFSADTPKEKAFPHNAFKPCHRKKPKKIFKLITKIRLKRRVY